MAGFRRPRRDKETIDQADLGAPVPLRTILPWQNSTRRPLDLTAQRANHSHANEQP
jgi:hypothetical protein